MTSLALLQVLDFGYAMLDLTLIFKETIIPICCVFDGC